MEQVKVLDRQRARAIVRAIDGVGAEPHRGKQLSGALDGYWSARADRDRYRVIYVIAPDSVEIVAVGPRRPGDRRDVYAKLTRLLGKRA